MKLLVDACAGQRLAGHLRRAGHDAVFVGDWHKDPGDDEILAMARAEERVIVTRDKDFGTLAVRDKLPNCGIVRLVELPAVREMDLCLQALARHAAGLARGALITVDAPSCAGTGVEDREQSTSGWFPCSPGGAIMVFCV
jgi:predicted nuclease of predicted toxin-antitoxin system